MPMRNVYLTYFLFFYFSTLVKGQGFGNDWITLSQPYYKIQIAEEGLYKISYELLASYDSLNFLDPGKLQLWHRGVQQHLSVHCSGNRLIQGDYLVFYGKKNDGWQDASLYYPTTNFYNPYANLYTDTTAYFLTVSSDAPLARTDTVRAEISTFPSRTIKTEYIKSFFDEYAQMAIDGEDPSQTFSVPGEGWCSGNSENLTYTFPLNNYIPGSEVILELFIIGRDKRGFSPSIYISDKNNPASLLLGQAIDTVHSPFGYAQVRYILSNDLSPYLTDGNLTLYLDHSGRGGISFGYIHVTSSQTSQFSSFQKSHFSPSSTQALAIDQVQPIHYFALLDDKGLSRLLLDTTLAATAYLPALDSTASILYATALDSISSLLPVSFQTYTPTDSTYLILTHPSLSSSVSTYAAYRATPLGGGYTPMIAYVTDVMDQFGYGERHPMGIRRFLNHLKQQNPGAPDQFFIIGQGIQLDFQQATRSNPSSAPTSLDLIPTAGVPGGDYLFSIHLDGDSSSNSVGHIRQFYSTIPTGRLQAKKNETVRGYLSKVQRHESLSAEEAPWRRNILHLSGGFQPFAPADVNAKEQEIIRLYMDGAANLAKLPYLGANVSTISRSSSQDSVELIDVSSQVNSGVSLITFLGHSGRFISDIWIGLVSKGNNQLGYSNKGRYPMLFLNGCRLGDVFIDEDQEWEKSVILDWVLTEDIGAILGLAGSATAFADKLQFYIQNHYITSFMDSANISKSAGEQMVAAQKRYVSTYQNPNNFPDEYGSSMIGNYSLQGDPAVKIFPNPKADYSIDCEKVALFPLSNRKITSQTDSFDIAIPLYNRGLYTTQPFTISVKRSFLNNTQSVTYAPQTFFPVREYDTVYFRIRGALATANGQNTFEVTIDPNNLVPELDKTNNRCTFLAYIPGVTMLCIHPQKFSIVHSQPVTFIAQSSTVTVNERDFYMELDTTYLFNSPFKKSATTKAFDLPMWSLPLLDLPFTDSVVYYWRTRYVQPESTEDTAFSYSSFLYVKDSPEGWSQSRYPQFFEDEAQGIVLDSLSGAWKFLKISAPIKAVALGNQTPKYDSVSSLTYKKFPLMYNNCYQPDNSIYLLTISSLNLNVKSNSLGNNPSYQCDTYSSPLVTKVSSLASSPSQQDSLYKILDKGVLNGDYILMMNIGNAGFSEFNASLRSLLRTQFGASRIDSLQDGHPYILLARKGYGAIAEKYAHSSQPFLETLQLDTTLTSLGYAGQIISPLIGPATQWGHFFQHFTKQAEDSIRFDIGGIDASGTETLVAQDIKGNDVELQSLINAQKYPYIRLYAYVQTKTSIAPQLLKWQVILQKSAEGTLLFDDSSASHYASFTKQEGDTSQILKFNFKNISSQAFLNDLIVRYKISNANKTASFYDTLHIALAPDSTWKTSFRVPTLGWVGTNTLEVFFNPPPGQTEEYLENNRFSLTYSVTADKTNPVLDVAFDGRRILNGELVAPNPTISIGVNDENKYLIRQDASGITVDLQRPCGQPNCPYERIDLSGNEVTIYPAGSNNKFELRYKPTNLPDGQYNLRVQATDVTGNLSGIKPYTIQFEIVNETSLSNFLPYPNPFSSKMWFVYTLTGEVPDQIRIQIMSITGIVVRQIFQDELGPLFVGTHRTDFVWDGKDDYGDPLANGVYLYKVTAKKNGEELKHRETSVDGMFKDGYGKLYILR